MLVYAHRGAPGIDNVGARLKGENTMGIFNKAVWNGARALEFDVRLSKDRQAVVIHDATIDRTTIGHGPVHSYFIDQLSQQDAGFGYGIPKLDNVFNAFGSSLLYNVELKEKSTENVTVNTICRYKLRSRILLSAFDSFDNEEGASSSWNQLNYGKDLGIATALLATERKIIDMGRGNLTEGWGVFIEEARKRGARALHPENSAVTSLYYIKGAHSVGLLVNVWTVNDSKRIQELREWGADGIITDCPEFL